MAKAEAKTKENDASVTDFIAAIADEKKRADSLELLKLMQKVSGHKPKMWGGSIIGFGSYHYKYDSGHEGDAPLVGFSPRKGSISIYLLCGLAGGGKALLEKLGRHKAGKGCLYIDRMADVDTKVLGRLIQFSIDELKKQIEKGKGDKK